METWAQLAITILGGGLGSLCLWVLSRMSNDLSKLRDSAEKLNSRLAVIIDKVDNHDKRISKLERQH